MAGDTLFSAGEKAESGGFRLNLAAFAGALDTPANPPPKTQSADGMQPSGLVPAGAQPFGTDFVRIRFFVSPSIPPYDPAVARPFPSATEVPANVGPSPLSEWRPLTRDTTPQPFLPSYAQPGTGAFPWQPAVPRETLTPSADVRSVGSLGNLARPPVPDLVSLFDYLDQNRDGRLSGNELGLAAISGINHLSGEDVLALRAIHHYYDNIAGIAHSGGTAPTEIGRDDIVALSSLLNRYERDESLSNSDASLAQAFLRDSYIPADANLYSDQFNPARSIVPEACKQIDGDGNCHFVAALASLAACDPQRIMNMIRDNGNHTYTVTFPGGDHPVTVMAAYGGNNAYGNWPQVMQQAYRTYCGYDMNNEKEQVSSASFLLASINDQGLRLLTGQGSIESYSTAVNSLATLDQKLKEAMEQRRPVVAGIPSRGLLDIASSSPIIGLPNSHAYSVLNYQSDSANPERSIVTVRNPWGRTSVNPEGGALPPGVTDLGNGLVSMPLGIFAREYGDITIGSIPGRQDGPIEKMANDRQWIVGGSTALTLSALFASSYMSSRNLPLAAGLATIGAASAGGSRYYATGELGPSLSMATLAGLPLLRSNNPGAAGFVAGGVGSVNLYEDFKEFSQTTRSDTRFTSGVHCLADLATISGGIALMFTPARRYGSLATTLGLVARSVL